MVEFIIHQANIKQIYFAFWPFFSFQNKSAVAKENISDVVVIVSILTKYTDWSLDESQVTIFWQDLESYFGLKYVWFLITFLSNFLISKSTTTFVISHIIIGGWKIKFQWNKSHQVGFRIVKSHLNLELDWQVVGKLLKVVWNFLKRLIFCFVFADRRQ